MAAGCSCLQGEGLLLLRRCATGFCAARDVLHLHQLQPATTERLGAGIQLCCLSLLAAALAGKPGSAQAERAAPLQNPCKPCCGLKEGVAQCQSRCLKACTEMSAQIAGCVAAHVVSARLLSRTKGEHTQLKQCAPGTPMRAFQAGPRRLPGLPLRMLSRSSSLLLSSCSSASAEPTGWSSSRPAHKVSIQALRLRR